MSACFQVLNEITSGTPLGVSNSQHPHECPAFSGQIPVELVFLDSSDGLVLKTSQVSSSKMKEKKKEKCSIWLIGLHKKTLGTQIGRDIVRRHHTS